MPGCGLFVRFELLSDYFITPTFHAEGYSVIANALRFRRPRSFETEGLFCDFPKHNGSSKIVFTYVVKIEIYIFT